MARVQFFLRGPFDPPESLSVTFYDGQGEQVAMTVLPSSTAWCDLQGEVEELVQRCVELFGFQLDLPVD